MAGLARFRPYPENPSSKKTREGSESGGQNQDAVSKAGISSGSGLKNPGGGGASSGVARKTEKENSNC
jgi:hypothetical protein